MYFYSELAIKYCMSHKKNFFLIIIIVALIVVVPILAIVNSSERSEATIRDMQVIKLWQIDSFEGGKGSRAEYLKNRFDDCFGDSGVYLSLSVISADAARENISLGNLPDLISYGAGFYGIEDLINRRDFSYKTWCNGSYCLLCIDDNADFDDVTAQNTIINAGKDNLVCVTSTLLGINGATTEQPTTAYLKLLNGKYKYLLGTQRDVFRLKTREVEFKVKKVECFNDLYQNISILTKDSERYENCKKFIESLRGGKSGIEKLGLYDGSENYSDQLNELCGENYNYTLKHPCGIAYINELTEAAKSGDANKIKNLLK